MTGARSRVTAGLDRFVTEVRTLAQIPVAVGFGISSAEQAATVGAFADGVIVGSALINAYDSAESDPVAAVGRFVQTLHHALRKANAD